MPKYTQAQIKTGLRRSRGLVHLAARMIGCTPKTIYNYAARYPSVQRVIDDQRGLLLDLAENNLAQRILAGDLAASQYVLDRLGKDRGYGPQVAVTGEDGGPVKVSVVELARLAAENGWDDIDDEPGAGIILTQGADSRTDGRIASGEEPPALSDGGTPG